MESMLNRTFCGEVHFQFQDLVSVLRPVSRLIFVRLGFEGFRSWVSNVVSVSSFSFQHLKCLTRMAGNYPAASLFAVGLVLQKTKAKKVNNG